MRLDAATLLLRRSLAGMDDEPTVKLFLLLLLSGALLTGCNTARGVGEDIQSLGHAISHAVS